MAEFLIAMGIGSILLLAVASLSLYSGRSLAAMLNYVDLDNDSRTALDNMSRDIRQCDSVTAFTSTSISLRDSDGLTLTYTFDPTAKTLNRIKSGVTKTLLEGCDALEFKIFQRNPVGGTYDQYPAATVATAKIVSVTWTCSRSILGTKSNTESVQTAKIVIRKQ